MNNSYVWHANCQTGPTASKSCRAGCWHCSAWFSPLVRENVEMLYQFEYDYRFDSSKVEGALGLAATGYREGIAATLNG